MAADSNFQFVFFGPEPVFTRYDQSKLILVALAVLGRVSWINNELLYDQLWGSCTPTLTTVTVLVGLSTVALLPPPNSTLWVRHCCNYNVYCLHSFGNTPSTLNVHLFELCAYFHSLYWYLFVKTADNYSITVYNIWLKKKLNFS